MIEDRLNIILNISNNSPNRIKESYIKKHYIDVYNNILQYTSKLEIPFKQRIWHWVNNSDNYILCSCGNRLSFNMNWRDGYKEFCSNKCSSNSNKVREKSKETLIEKYGVDHYSKTEDFTKKVRETSLERYGVSNYSKTKDYLIKSKETCISKYGVDSYTKTEDYLIKSKETCISKYGVDSYTKTEEFNKRFRETMFNKYDNINIKSNNIFRLKNFNISKDINYVKYLNNSINLFKCDFGKDHNFEISTDNYYGRLYSKNKLCTICNPISDNTSLKEESLYNYINSLYHGNITKSYRDILEIDIYLPDLRLGFEFNGVWWHSDRYKDKWYHLNKTNYFKKRGIRIIHIWEDDWVYKQDIVRSQISTLLNNSNKIFARKCKIREITDSKMVTKFLDENHIQGKVNSCLKLGLYYNDELVSLMTFDKFEGRKKLSNTEWNINRFCNKLGNTIIGGASKLLKHFINEYNPSRIISYADKDWSVGDLYYKLGFEKISESKPDYKYIIDGIRIHKSNFKKSITKTKLTESNYTKSLGIKKVYDCGKIKFEMYLKQETH